MILEHLDKDLTNVQICNEIKDKNITIETFGQLQEEERTTLKQSIEFVHDDRHGQKRLKLLLESHYR